MSRSGYSDDCDHLELYRQSVENAILGARGQRFMRRLRDALEAMPVKRLTTGYIARSNGDVCALGSIDPAVGVDPDDPDAVAKHFDIARSLAAEIAYENDEGVRLDETPEERWTRMRAWVQKQIGPTEGDQ